MQSSGTEDPEEEALRAAGIHIVGDERPLVRGECMRIARRLISTRAKVIGFVPARDDVAVPPVAIQLGLALVELTGATAAFVDANVRYPALADLPSSGKSDDNAVYLTRWLKGSLALLTPHRAERPGEAVPALANLLLGGIALFEHVLVDLTGFDKFGEHASAAACCDGVALVGRAKKTKEEQILSFMNDMPHRRFLGVLLVG